MFRLRSGAPPRCWCWTALCAPPPPPTTSTSGATAATPAEPSSGEPSRGWRRLTWSAGGFLVLTQYLCYLHTQYLHTDYTLSFFTLSTHVVFRTGTGDCEVSETSKSCSACRFEKCLQVGMKRELLQVGDLQLLLIIGSKYPVFCRAKETILKNCMFHQESRRFAEKHQKQRGLKMFQSCLSFHSLNMSNCRWPPSLSQSE